MPVNIQLMSSDRYSFDIFEGYNIRSLKNDAAELFRIRDIDRIVIFTNDNQEVNDADLVEEDSFFHVFISDPLTVKIVYENEEILLYFNEKLIDINSYHYCTIRGIEYDGLGVPDRPFILQVDPSIRNNAYRYIIRIFYDQWLQYDDEYLYGVHSEFDYYYLSKISKYNQLYADDYDYDDDDNDDEIQDMDEEDQQIEDLLRTVKSSDHLYIFLNEFLPRNKNKYDNWLRPINIIQIDYL